jgi:hypothetical protein
MREHHALARRLLDRQDDYPRFTRDPCCDGDRRPVRAGDEVGTVALDPGQVTGFRFEVAVDAFHGAVEGDEPVPLDRSQTGDGFGGLRDLLVDSVAGQTK